MVKQKNIYIIDKTNMFKVKKFLAITLTFLLNNFIDTLDQKILKKELILKFVAKNKLQR